MFSNKKIATYIGRSCKDSHDIRLATERLTDVSIPYPKKRVNKEIDPKEKLRIDETIKGLFSKDLDTFVKRENAYRQNKTTLYSLVCAQTRCEHGWKQSMDSRMHQRSRMELPYYN